MHAGPENLGDPGLTAATYLSGGGCTLVTIHLHIRSACHAVGEFGMR